MGVVLRWVVVCRAEWPRRGQTRAPARVLRVALRSATKDRIGTVPATRVRTVPRNVQEARRARSQAVRKKDRKSTRLNSSHANISYAVFCLKKKKKKNETKYNLTIQQY